MEERKKESRLVVRWKAVLACVLCLVLGATAALGGIWAAVGPEGRTLLQAQKIIEGEFVGEYDVQTQLQTTLAAMVKGLEDRWSTYLTPERYAEVVTQRTNTYVGIGVTVDHSLTDGLFIQDVVRDGPAWEAGLVPGEIIRKVEGQAVTEETRQACLDTIPGEEGTTVTLEVEGLDGMLREVEVQRQTIQEIPVEWTLTQDGVGLITLHNFFTGSAQLMAQGVEELQAQGARALILDVRNNGGGYVLELTDMLDTLLPEGTIFVSEDVHGNETVYTSDEAFVDLPLAVLVNGNSYSASEFLAAQLRESVNALVVGTPTCGKGYSQMLFPLADGSAINLSTARYYTGGGVSLIGTGVEPDPLVELTEEGDRRLLAGDLPLEEDAQYQAAVEALGLAR